MPSSITLSNKFLDAVLRLKCPPGNRDVLFAMIRLIKGAEKYPCGVFPFQVAEYLKKSESQISKRIYSLIKINVIKVTIGPSYLPLRVFEVNFNYKEWKVVKHAPVKTKKNSAEPTFWDCQEAEISCSESPESAAVVKTITPLKLKKQAGNKNPILKRGAG